MVSKNDTGVAHYDFTAHQPILVIFGEMLQRERAIEWLFVIAPLLSNISALRGKHEPRKLSFQLRWQSGYLPRPPMSSDRNGILRGG